MISRGTVSDFEGAPLFRFTPGMNRPLRRPDSGSARCGDFLWRAATSTCNASRDAATWDESDAFFVLHPTYNTELTVALAALSLPSRI